MRKFWLFLLIFIAIAAGIGLYLQHSDKSVGEVLSGQIQEEEEPEEEAEETSNPKKIFKNYGQAPQFEGITNWINSEPIKIEELKGKVVLVQFWTTSCINCVRTLPYVNQWLNDYKDKGLVVIGVHTPEFVFEKTKVNVDAAVKRHGITYPVALDNNYKTWQAYKNQFWPATYLITTDGHIVYTQFGEGKYDVTEKAIRTLLGMEGPFDIPQATVDNQSKTPEIQLGLTRLKSFGGSEKPNNSEQIYTFPKKLSDGKFALEGNWQFNQEAAVHTTGFGKIKLNFNAAKVSLVAKSNKPTTIKVYVDGKLIKGVVVTDSNLYELFNSLSGGPHTMEIEIPEGGFEAFTFTFG